MSKAIVVFVAIVHLAIVSGQYECFLDDLRIFQLYGKNYTCGAGLFCNVEPLGKVITPCINKTEVCNGVFQCDPNDKKGLILTLHGINAHLECYGDTFCNSDPEKNCIPCSYPKCPKATFECVDTTHVILEGFNFALECERCHVCNEKNVYPCSACIPTNGENSLSTATTISATCTIATATKGDTNPSITTTTTGETSLSTLADETSPSTTTKSETSTLTTTTEGETSPSTTTAEDTTTPSTTTTKATTTIPVPKPKCNDGLGWSKPCRPGSKDIYFRCIYKIYWWEYEEIRCSEKEKDYLCKGVKTICKT